MGERPGEERGGGRGPGPPGRPGGASAGEGPAGPGREAGAPRGEAPVSVAVVARDEEDRLPRTLRSVGWAAETVVVVDGRTRDRTAEVAREHGARVVVRTWRSYATQTRRALERCRCPWVLLLDADEVVSPGLAREIVSELSSETDGAPAGWEIPFHTRYLGRWLGRRGWYTERHLRLVRRERASVTGGPEHAGLDVDGPVGRLSGPVLHYSYRDVTHHAEKVATYARHKAARLEEDGRTVTLVGTVVRAAGGFLQEYLLKGRVLDGVAGLAWGLMRAYYKLITYAHLWELDGSGRDGPADASRSRAGRDAGTHGPQGDAGAGETSP